MRGGKKSDFVTGGEENLAIPSGIYKTGYQTCIFEVQLPVVEVPNLAQTLQRLLQLKIRCIAAHPHTDSRILSQADFTQDCCIVFGSEGVGISLSVLAACDEAVAIPMSSGVDSLNVASASAVFLYEASRQRGEREA